MRLSLYLAQKQEVPLSWELNGASAAFDSPIPGLKLWYLKIEKMEDGAPSLGAFPRSTLFEQILLLLKTKGPGVSIPENAWLQLG